LGGSTQLSLSAGSFDRPATWVSGLRIAQDNILTGVGPRHVAETVASDPRYSQTPFGTTTSNPHNAWLFVADSEGTPYAILLVLISVALIRAAFVGAPSAPRRYILASLTAGGAVFFVNNLFDHPEIMLYIVLACALAVTEVVSPGQPVQRRPSFRSPAWLGRRNALPEEWAAL
jgi:O-antigen ligase